jgi:hypothetical protein
MKARSFRKSDLNERVRYFPMKGNSEISNSITKNWTEQAIRCYLSNCNCIDCSISKGNYSFVCQMSSVTKILLDQIGPPEQNKINKMTA